MYIKSSSSSSWLYRVIVLYMSGTWWTLSLFLAFLLPHKTALCTFRAFSYIYAVVPWTITRTQHEYNTKKLFEIKLKQYWLPVCVVFMLSMWFTYNIYGFSQVMSIEEIGRLNGTSFDDYDIGYWCCYIITIKIIRAWI